MKCKSIASKLRHRLSVAIDDEPLTTTADDRNNRHAASHIRSIKQCLDVKVDKSQGGKFKQHCSSVVLIMSEEDARMIIKALEARDD